MPESDILSAIQEDRLSLAKIDLERLLKRFPNKSYYWALNCYLLYAQGRLSQATSQCKELAQKVPSDVHALSVLYDVYVKLGLSKEAGQLYERAIKKYPTRELIDAYLEKSLDKFDASGMQKASMQLLKNFKSSREYAYRAAITCYFMSTRGTDKERTLYLGLGTGIVEKMAPHENNQEIFVHAKLLHVQERFAEVVKLIEPLKHRDLELLLLYRDSLEKSENWQQLYDESYKLLFELNFNDFSTWKHLIYSATKLEKSYEEVSKLISLDNRNAYFAKIHLATAYGLNQHDTLENFYLKFQDKPSCAVDLLNFHLPSPLLDKIHTDYKGLTEKPALSSKQAIHLVNCIKILLSSKRLNLNEIDLLMFPNPELIDLHLVKMIESLRADSSSDNIVKYIITLEEYKVRDPENFKVKVWLLNFYTAIGATPLAIKVYKDLKIKMIQQDTLLHKLDLLPSVGNLSELINTYRFYMTADGEVRPYVRNALQKSLYTKVEDFFKFGERLTHSLLRHLLTLRILKTSRMLGNDYYNYFYRLMRDNKASILSDNFVLHDNRDFTSEYNLGVEILQLDLLEYERRKGTEYVKLNYLKELLIAEKDPNEIEKLIKLFNKWISSPEYISQLSKFEGHLVKLYHSIFKLAKLKEFKDKDLVTKFLLKNLNMNKIDANFLQKTQPISAERQRIFLDTFELIKVVQLLINDKSITDAAGKMQIDMVSLLSVKPQLLPEIKLSLKLQHEFVSDQFDAINDALKLSSLKL